MRHLKALLLGTGAIVALGLAAAPAAHAEYIEYLYQDGSNVDATGSGSIDTTNLHVGPVGPSTPFVWARSGQLNLGASGTIDVYGGVVGPTSFGAGGFDSAASGTGNFVAIAGASHNIAVPSGYASGTDLETSTATWDGTTLAALGVTDGTYTWTWGTGDHADSIVLNIGTAPPVPEPASIALLGIGLAGVGTIRRRRRR